MPSHNELKIIPPHLYDLMCRQHGDALIAKHYIRSTQAYQKLPSSQEVRLNPTNGNLKAGASL